jgi:hypothetical protein
VIYEFVKQVTDSETARRARSRSAALLLAVWAKLRRGPAVLSIFVVFMNRGEQNHEGLGDEQ